MKRAQTFLCSLLVHLGLHVNISKSDLWLMQQLSFLGLCWNAVGMSVSLPSDKLWDIEQLAQALLQSQPVMVWQVMSFLGKTALHANGHAQFFQFCVIQSDMLNVITLPCIYLFLFAFSFSVVPESSSLAISFSWCSYCYWCYAPHWAFYIQSSGVSITCCNT